MASGRIEQENKIKQKIYKQLNELPDIFTDFYNYLEADNKSYGTCQHYLCYVEDFMRATVDNITDDFYKNITVADIRSYITSLRRRDSEDGEVKNGDSIQATRWSAINTFYNFLVMDDYLDFNPMTKTKRPKNKTDKPIVYLEKNEIDCILDKIREESKPQYANRDVAIVILGVATGIRVGALTQINIEDINFRDNTIHVIEKGGKERYLKFGDNTRNILSAWLLDRNTYFDNVETNALFISQYRQRLTRESVRKLLIKYADGINGKHITPHCLRKSAATNMIKQGVDLPTIAEIMNHSNVNTTLRYAAAVEENKNRAVAALDKIFD